MAADDSIEDFPKCPSVLSLRFGGHNEDVLDKAKALISASTQHATDVEPSNCPSLTYGPQLGSERYRTALAAFLSRRYNRAVSRESLVLTCGATHALHLLTTQLFNTGSLVFVEDPSYYLAINLLRQDLRMRLVPVPVTSGGMDMDVLERKLVKHRELAEFQATPRQPYWSMVYVIPDHQNPTGTCMSPENRDRLVRLARRFDLLVFCDDVYNLLPLRLTDDGPADTAATLVSRDRASDADFQGHVVSAGTFSKICAPGVRVGWLEAPPRLVDILSRSQIFFSGGAVNNWMSSVLASAMELGLLDKHLDWIISRLQEKLRLSVELLESSLPGDRFTCSTPQGGFFIWLRCPFETAAFLEWCGQQRQVTALAGRACAVDGDTCSSHLRVSYSYLSLEPLRAALQRLISALLQYDPR